MKKRLAVYIHIPFCVKKCKYCDFLSAPDSKSTIDKYVETLCREISNFQHIQEYEVYSIFFGGGTPSILSKELIDRIMNTLYTYFDINSSAEISMECNPGTATLDKLRAYRLSGINRLSIGLQSANNDELRTLGRIHTYEDFEATFRWAREAKFDNINVDIMSALPGQSYESYLNTVSQVLRYRPEHISSYSLIIEEGTPFYDVYGPDVCTSDDILALPDEDTEREMYYATENELNKAGYRRYEISNYALEGYECRHNLVYWSGEDYVGFGLGASSYLGGVRYRNDSVLVSYIEGNGEVKHLDVIALQNEDKMEEFMFLGLRKIGGVSLKEWHRRFGCDISDVYGDVLAKLSGYELIERYHLEDEEYIRLTSRGIDVSNTVLSEFLIDRD